MMTDDEIIEVVQAHKDGKWIQYKSNIHFFRHPSDWTDCTQNDPCWCFTQCNYRVKPEPRKPREWILHVPLELVSGCKTEIFDAKEVHHGGQPSAKECVRVREVIE